MRITVKHSAEPKRRTTLVPWLAGFMLALVVGPVAAQTPDSYPSKPLRLIVPYPPGGVTDNASRLIGERLGRELGQTVVIENKAGAASTLASNLTARAAPDGYTVYAAPVSLVINPVLQAKVEYDPQKDFEPISLMMTSAFVLQANKDFKAKNLKDLISLVRANPDKFSIGTSGVGSINHLAAEYFIKSFGLKMAVIHYKGGIPAAQDLIGGRIEMMFSATNEALPMLAAGRTHGIAVSVPKRVATLPDLPTIDEASGTTGFDAVFWLALVTPAKVPEPIVNRLKAAMQVVGQDQALKTDLALKGVDLKVSSADEVRQYMQRDGAKWGQIIRELGIKE
ncbi:MAG: ABC transporter substrate-binding protein [Alcaligenaceae bacterium]|nr:MAG: ABC transporter substrate-binding protein [Alcaligenaceae bacterium]